MDGLQGIAHFFRELGHFQAGVCRVTTSVVEEIADIVCFEHRDQALVFSPILLEATQLVAAGPEGTGRGCHQSPNRFFGFLAGIYQVLTQRTYNAVATGVHLANQVFVLGRGFNDPAGRGIDNGGNSAGLCIKGVGF